ncbi:MAG TPA: hypothetical protein VF574_15030 [Allosphingosinicella sp.]|jgi:hypothetical protein
MKFFVPAARDPAMAEQAWEATRRFLADQGCPTTRRRIRRLAFGHDGEDFDLVVGGIHPGLEFESFLDAGGEDQVWRYLVFVILESSGRPCYYVCTGARGVLQGFPWLVGFPSVTLIEDFEPRSRYADACRD